MSNKQASRAILMVRPTTFGFDEQTAETNSFQHHVVSTHDEVLKRVNDEFEAMVVGLKAHDIEVIVFTDTQPISKPNAVFPNNWISTWPNGRVYLYPMATESRRVERSAHVLQALSRHFRIDEIIDLSEAEQNLQYLESTGVMVFDHEHKIVYGCVSERCDEQLFRQHAAALGYRPIVIHAYDATDTPVYHTNLLMGVQTTTAVICTEAIPDKRERSALVDLLVSTGHEVVEIGQTQMADFCGNILEVQNAIGDRFVVMSTRAHDAFTPEQRAVLGKDKTILSFAVPTIEIVGGGSVRCMQAEVFLPPKHSQPTVSISGHYSLETQSD